MKGQYFSFDAIIATVIMVMAFTSLVAYWFGVQSVAESKTSPMYNQALRIAESLLSPGAPADWPDASIDEIKQLGLTDDFGTRLNKTKVKELVRLSETNYKAVGKLLRAGGEGQNYYILIEQADDASTPPIAQIGKWDYLDAKEVAIAHRGATFEIDGKHRPVRIRVFLWQE